MCFLRSKIFTFSKMSLTSILKKKSQKIKRGTNTEGRKKTSTFLCRKNSEVSKEKAFFIDKWRLKATKWWLHSGTLKAVDVTFLDVLVRQNDLVYTKIQLFMCFLRSKIFTFSKNVAYINFQEKRQKKLKEEQIQKEEKRQVHSCAGRIQRYGRKRLSSLTKVKMEAKGDKMMIS